MSATKAREVSLYNKGACLGIIKVADDGSAVAFDRLGKRIGSFSSADRAAHAIEQTEPSDSDVPVMLPPSTPSESAAEPTTPEWDGFADPFWNLGQLILWVATGNRDHVHTSSDRSGRYDASYALVAAAALIDEQIPTRDGRERTANEIQERGIDGTLKVYDMGFTRPKELTSVTWTKLEIVFDPLSGIPFVRWRGHWNIVPAYELRFSRETVLQCFPASDSTNDALLGFWELPDQIPKQKAQQDALRALRLQFREGRVPKHLSAKRLADMASTKTGLRINRDAIQRVLGRKK